MYRGMEKLDLDGRNPPWFTPGDNERRNIQLTQVLWWVCERIFIILL